MAEYIERETLLELYRLDDPVLNEIGYVPLPIIRQNIMDLPTADVVEVVRCRECRYWHDQIGWCDQHSTFLLDGEPCRPDESAEWKMFDEDNFCSYGERREHEAKDQSTP